MRYQKKMSFVTVVFVMILIFMMSVAVYADENDVNSDNSTGEESNIMDVLKGAYGYTGFGGVDLNGVNLNGVEFSGIDLNSWNLSGIDLNGIDLKGSNFNAQDLKNAALSGKAEEYLKSLGYSDEDIEKLKSVLLDSFNNQISQAVNAALAGKDANTENLQEAQVAEPQIYVVKRGDNLSKIAKNVYGDAGKWTVIYELNRDQIRNPNEIEIGQILIIG